MPNIQNHQTPNPMNPRPLSNISMVQIAKPCCDCVVEIFDGPGGFTVVAAFAAMPSPEVSHMLLVIDKSHPGMKSLEAEAQERIEMVKAMTGHFGQAPQIQAQRSHYHYTLPHVYNPKTFGTALCEYLSQRFGLSTKFMLWGEQPQVIESYAAVTDD